MALGKEWQIKTVARFWLAEELRVDTDFLISSFLKRPLLSVVFYSAVC